MNSGRNILRLPWKWFLNHPWLMVVIALLFWVLIFTIDFAFVPGLHRAFVRGLPGALISVMGFIIAAAAIALSIQDRGNLRTLTEYRPDLWNRLMGVFFAAAKSLGLFAVYLLLIDQFPRGSWHPALVKLVHSVSLTWFALVIMQVGTSIYALEQAARTSTIQRRKEAQDTAPKKYSMPDVPIHTYQEPKQ